MLRAMAFLAIGWTLLAGSKAVHAFEVKGITPGMPIASVNTESCKKIPNADSGVPGFQCQTSLGGSPGTVNIGVMDDVVVLAVFNIPAAMMTPTRDALAEKYGPPRKPNRYIESYSWDRDQLSMTIKTNRLAGGFDVLLVDWTLFNRAQDAQKNQARGDI